MTRNLKALGLALVAVFAMSALVAASASAKYTSTSEHTYLTGANVGDTVIHTTAGTLTCKKRLARGQ